MRGVREKIGKLIDLWVLVKGSQNRGPQGSKPERQGRVERGDN